MNASRFTRRSLLALFLSVTLTGAYARAQQYEPHVGQEGKDVIWVPTPQALVDKMLDVAKVTPKDYVIDLGSGDGRTVITAAKRGARALGIEYNPDMVELSKRNAAKAGVTDKANFVKADLFESDFSQATVITMFLLPDINLRLRPKILDLKPGIRIVSNSFTMGDWKADDTVTVTDDCASYCTAYLWIVPAKVEGKWQLPQGELTLNQTYQMISGTLKNGSNVVQIANGKLNGNEVTFNAGGSLYTGRVNGNAMEGNRRKLEGDPCWKVSGKLRNRARWFRFDASLG
jgi:SAM-dependent methyltransferase